MQPLISPVDHESRNNSYNGRTENDHEERNEDTPLLHRFPETNVRTFNFSSPYTSVVISLLLFILLAGIVIGIYLLIEQSNSENVVPPITALHIVSRAQWDPEKRLLSNDSQSPLKATKVIILQTDSEKCQDDFSCAKLLQYLQMTQDMPYNFLISSNGDTYEAHGWHSYSPQYSISELVLGFIGNFTDEAPTMTQIEGAERFLEESMSRDYLRSSFIIVGKNTKPQPTKLFEKMSRFRQWNPSGM